MSMRFTDFYYGEIRGGDVMTCDLFNRNKAGNHRILMLYLNVLTIMRVIALICLTEV